MRAHEAQTAAPARRLSLSAPTYDADDVCAAVATLIDGWPTHGPIVEEVEGLLAGYLGVRNAIMVSSGGGANLLLMLFAASPYASPLCRLSPGDEVIVPAIAWSTTVTPLLAIQCTPVFCDIERQGLNIDVGRIEALITPKTKGVMIVHCLGTACDLDALSTLCAARGLFLIEDSCEALGTRWGDRHVGGEGAFGTFSFYFSHHLCAVEGGLITTPDDAAAAVLRSMRANGYAPGRLGRPDNGFAGAVDTGPNVRAHFPTAGFNFKTTNLNAALLRGQIARLDSLVERRNRAAERYRARLAPLGEWLELPVADPRCRPSWMAFPIIVTPDAPFTRQQICTYLQQHGVDTRPVIGGNIAEQPFMSLYPHRKDKCRRATLVHDNGFMVGVHHAVTDDQIDHVGTLLEEFLTQHATPMGGGYDA